VRVATYFDEHADLSLVQSRFVAILGDDAEAVVHATLLRDSGVDVHLGATPDSRAADLGEGEGLLCVDPATAVAEADLVVLTRTDAARGPLLEAARPEITAGTAVVCLDPVALHLGLLRMPSDVDVVVVSPLAAAEVVAREFTAGRGVPTVVAVAQDVTGSALDLALSYAKAIGGTRGGAMAVTVAAAGETALFGQHAVVGGVVDGLVRTAFDVLAAAGYPHDLAYVACVHTLHAAMERTYGPDDAAAPGTHLAVEASRTGGQRLVDAGLRHTLEAALADVQAGSIAASAVDVRESSSTAFAVGAPDTESAAAAGAPHRPEAQAFEAAGRRVRHLMPWMAAPRQDARHAR